jgi:putative zinc finger protein
MNIDEITCDWFEARLSAYLEDDLDGETRADMDKHVIACDACNALVMDLRALSVDARVLPDLVAPRDLWDGIATRIEAPVIGIDSGLARPAARTGVTVRWATSPRFRDARLWMGTAAAGLVALTAGVTYLATKHAYGGAPVHVAAMSSPEGGSSARDASDSARTVASLVTGANPTAVVQPGGGSTLGSTAPAFAAQVRTVAATKTTVEQTYDLEIARLRGIVNTRRSRLDPYTVSVIERSLSVIDQAIAESRAALAKDPASGFLSEQLNSALDKKVQLLRTAAMLPART